MLGSGSAQSGVIGFIRPHVRAPHVDSKSMWTPNTWGEADESEGNSQINAIGKKILLKTALVVLVCCGY